MIENGHEQPVSLKELRTKRGGQGFGRPIPPMGKELMKLFVKLAIIILVVVMLFTFIFGFHRVDEGGMMPAVQDGDLVIFNRFDRNYAIGDLVVLDFEGRRQVRRVVAHPGDEVNITDEGLLVNGAIQQEHEIYYLTHQFEEGVEFPLSLTPGQIFVLGDSREQVTDSRIYGPVNISDTHGKVFTVLRRRKF